jgi:hypothetical protein
MARYTYKFADGCAAGPRHRVLDKLLDPILAKNHRLSFACIGSTQLLEMVLCILCEGRWSRRGWSTCASGAALLHCIGGWVCHSSATSGAHAFAHTTVIGSYSQQQQSSRLEHHRHGLSVNRQAPIRDWSTTWSVPGFSDTLELGHFDGAPFSSSRRRL